MADVERVLDWIPSFASKARPKSNQPHTDHGVFGDFARIRSNAQHEYRSTSFGDALRLISLGLLFGKKWPTIRVSVHTNPYRNRPHRWLFFALPFSEFSNDRKANSR